MNLRSAKILMELFSWTGEMERIAFFAFVFPAIFFLVLTPDDSFGDVDLRADFSYFETIRDTGGVKKSASAFNQTYTLTVRKRLTSTISLFGDVKWTILETDKERTTSVYPIFTLDFAPRAFYNTRVGHSRTESARSTGERISSSSTHAMFSLPETRWPSLMLSANRSTSQDHATPKGLDSVSTNLSANSGYSFTVLNTRTLLNYSFVDTLSQDKIGGVESLSPYHHASVGLSRSFLEGMLRSNANLGYELSDTTSTSTAGPSRFEQRINQSEGLSFFNPADPLNITLDEESELIDLNTTTPVSPSINLNDANWNIGLGFFSAEAVFKIYIFINTTEDEKTNIKNTYDFGWQLYK